MLNIRIVVDVAVFFIHALCFHRYASHIFVIVFFVVVQRERF